MALKDFFEVEGLQLEGGAVVFSGSFDPTAPPNQAAVNMLSTASNGSLYLRASGELWQKTNNAWEQMRSATVGNPMMVEAGQTLVINGGFQYSVYMPDYVVDGDINVEGDGELIIHE